MASLLKTHLMFYLAAGGAAGDITVTGVAATDVIVSVFMFKLTEGTPNTFSSITNLTAEFTTGANKINNTSGTNTTAGLLLIVVEKTPGKDPKNGQTGYR